MGGIERLADRVPSTQPEAPDSGRFDGDSTKRNWLTFYYVVEDQTAANGKNVMQVPISPFFSTPEDAKQALAVLKEMHPKAKAIVVTHMYPNNAEGLAQRDACLQYLRAPGDMRPPLYIRYTYDE